MNKDLNVAKKKGKKRNKEEVREKRNRRGKLRKETI
jgi:hypothetical protein